MIGCLIFGLDLGIKISLSIAVVEAVFFFMVARSPANLYHFECTLRFLKDIKTGEDYVYKHEEQPKNKLFQFFKVKQLLKKVQGLTHIKKIHNGKYIEYTHEKTRPHNWGGILELKTFQPEDLEMFAENAERFLIGVEDKTIIKTTLKVRSDLTDYALPIRMELQKNRVPQIVRDSMFEHQQMCENADEKSYKNHMLVLIDYTANPEKAKHKLDVTIHAISEILDDMAIGYKRLETEDEILSMFFEDITYNIHNAGRV
jgi:hypothetical protein